MSDADGGLPPEAQLGSEDAETERPKESRGGIFQDSVRKVLVGGASALLMTEGNIRSALSDVRLPKDAVSFLLGQTDRTRREVVRLVSKELKAAVDKMDLRGELRRTLLGLNVDVRATIAFREDKDAPKVRVRSKVRRRKQREQARDRAQGEGARAPTHPTEATAAARPAPIGQTDAGPNADAHADVHANANEPLAER